MRVSRCFVPVLALSLCAPLQTGAQASRVLTGVGYGALGMAAGIAATSGSTCEGFVCIPDEMVVAALIGGGIGTFLGAGAAASANRAVGEGRPVGGGRVAAIAVGTVLGGATLGALASSLLINGEGSGTFLGSDERTVTLFMLAGTALAGLQLRRNWGRLTGRVDVQPILTMDGRAGLATRVRL